MSDETKIDELESEQTEAASDVGKAGPRKKKQMIRPKKEAKISGAVDFEERVVAVNRVAKVVKGGRRFSFSALIIVGDKRGKVGYGLGKAKEVPEAIKKAISSAQRKMIHVSIDGGTIPHEVLGKWDAGRILLKPAADGTGIKAAGACRSILELAGIKNVLTKSLRGNNPHNIVKATFDALKGLRSKEEIAKIRGKNVKNIRLKV